MALHGIGRQDDAMLLINQAIDYCRVTGDRWMQPELLRIKGEYLLSKEKPQPDNAESAFIKALEVAREHEAKSWELRTAISLAEFWRSQERESEARDLITPIYEWFSEGFGTPDLRAANSLLESLS